MKTAVGALLVLLLGFAASGCGPGFAVPVRDTGVPQPSRQPKVVHIVRKGDTLYSIAFDAGLDYRAVARWNGIKPPYVISPGRKLRLRPPPGYKPPTRTAASGSRAGTATTQPSASASTRASSTSSASASSPASGTTPGSAQSPASSSPPASTASRQPAPPPRSTTSGAVESWLWPARGAIIRGFSQDSANPGIDIAGEEGDPVKSAAGGRVVYSGDGLRGYGQLIIVKHNETFLSAYAHNRKLLVREGDQVRRGQPIAEMGSTGTNRVMLHFEIRKQGTAVDPLQYLPNT